MVVPLELQGFAHRLIELLLTGAGGFGVLDHSGGVLLGTVRGELVIDELPGRHERSSEMRVMSHSHHESSGESQGGSEDLFVVGADSEEYE